MAVTSGKSANIVTVAGVAAVAYVLTTIAHEGIGHGGMCVAVGGHPVAWGAYYFDCDTHALPAWAGRAVAAAGSTVNLILCLFYALLLGADLKKPGPHRGWTVFLWLMMAINGFTWAGYFLFSGVAGIGDWGEDGVLKGISNPLIWRVVEGVVGLVLYIWLARVVMAQLGRIVGGNMADARRISFTAYATGGLIGLLVGLMNPIGIVIVLISSLASSLGGTSGLLWGVRMIKRDVEGVDFALPRNLVWVALGIVAAVAYAYVFGPTLKL